MSNLQNRLENNHIDKSAARMLQNPAVMRRIEEVLGDRKNEFTASLVSAMNANAELKNCDGGSVLACAFTAAALNLPINNNLGFAYLIPYKNRKAGITECQFQLGYRGYIQLALRTAQYSRLNVVVIKDGELKSFNPLTEDLEIEFLPIEKRNDAPVVGYAAYMRMVNGFEKTVYWSRERVEAHAKRFSFAYSKGWETPWKTDFDEMAMKTVLKAMLNKWGVLSVELQKAFENDSIQEIPTAGMNLQVDNNKIEIETETENPESAPLEVPEPEADEKTNEEALF